MNTTWKRAKLAGLAAFCFAVGFGTVRAATATSSVATTASCSGVSALHETDGTFFGCTIAAHLTRTLGRAALISRVEQCCNPPAPTGSTSPALGQSLTPLRGLGMDLSGFFMPAGATTSNRVTVVTVTSGDQP